MEPKVVKVVLARYSKKHNAVAERALPKYFTVPEAIDIMENNRNRKHSKPIMVYIDGCVEWDKPGLGMIMSTEYHNEYRKVVD